MQPIFQNIVEHWHRLGGFFAVDAELLTEPSMVLWVVLFGGVLGFSTVFSRAGYPPFFFFRLDL